MLKPKKIIVNKKDYLRALITETIPYETPVIFSNDGFYLRCREAATSTDGVFVSMVDRLVKGVGKNEKYYTIPYQYKIRKNSLEYRHLALPHPMAQWRMMKFYEKYEKLITYFCENSPVSIRAPYRVASSCFYKSPLANVNQYKRGRVQDDEGELFSKHSSSFFAYQGYDRLHKFFNSEDFLSLEKRWPCLWAMDVAKCFDSIYTHSITWATKEKEFVKKSIGHGMFATFGNDFDELMQKSNYNETNGIVIGPEVSRIFAEIIFQKIDSIVVELALLGGLRVNDDFAVRRYVDDIYIFAPSPEVAQRIFELYSNELQKFNLHVNKGKTVQYVRPFFTRKSQVVSDVNEIINLFAAKFLKKVDDEYSLEPIEIIRESKLARSFIDAVKSVCIANEVTYDDVASYIIGAFFERIKRVINVESISDDNRQKYKSALSVIVEILFFFYTAAPSVSASYKLCSAIILVSRFSDLHMPIYADTIKQRIFELGVELFSIETLQKETKLENLVRLESVNVLLALSELGTEYLLPADVVSRVLLSQKKFSYFDIVACLFYVRDFPQYETLRKFVIAQVEKCFVDIAEVEQKAERACLFLDLLSCPYIDSGRKVKWLKRYVSTLGPLAPSSADIYTFVGKCAERTWFVNWQEIDLLNTLERKELKRAY